MSITIDTESGFCFGVTSAIRKAEEELQKGELFCLGDIVHNGQEVERLANLGLETIDYDDLRTLHHVRVLLRAHGEPPSTYRIAHDNDIEIIDASCPVVKKLQERIRTTYRQHPEAQIVIFGKAGHAEVIGLQGQTNNTAFVVQDKDALPQMDYSRDIYLFSQTTMSVEDFQQLAATLREHMEANDGQQHGTLHVSDTICRNVANRVGHLREFAAANDLVIFVGGKKSSNAKVLFAHCQEANPATVFVDSPDELTTELLQANMPEGCALQDARIGICGATSTPLWLMEACKQHILLTTNIQQ